MEYLGHIVDRDGVWLDPKNIQAMKDWPRPKTLMSLRGLLGLTRYYRKFVRNYGKIYGPLTHILNKKSFSWDDPTKQSFISLKNDMYSTLVLVVPNFSKPFVLECDAFSIGLRVVLTQEGRTVAFTSKKLFDHNLGKYTYEKEMMSILHVVETWQPYLLGCHFQIKIGHHNLQYFLEQKLSSPTQHKWATKMLVYDYEIIYKKGKDIVVEHALSH